MRIVLVNWAKIWEGAAQGGGVNQYVQALAIELVGRGHDVVSLCGGTEHYPGLRGPVIRRHADWFGIKVFEVINSPVLAPSLAQFERPLDEVSSPPLEEEVGRLFEHLRPGAIHWNNLEGFSIGCVEAGKRSGARTVFSLHNYHTICPQVYLMQRHRVACYDYDNGHNCAKCVDIVPVEVERKKYEALHPDPWAEELKKARSTFADSVKSLGRWLPAGRRYLALKAAGKQSVAHELPGRPVQSMDDATGLYTGGHSIKTAENAGRSFVISPDDPRGDSRHLLAELDPKKPADYSLPQYRPLTNDIFPEPPSDKAPNAYAKRRGAMVAMLNGCDAVLAVSDFVRRKYIALGVSPAVIRTVPIGSRINRVVSIKPELKFDPAPFKRPETSTPEELRSERPIRILFIGIHNYYKGFGFLAESLEELPPEILRRLHMTVYAFGGRDVEWMYERLRPRLAGLRYGWHYWFHDLPWLCGGQDMVIVPSVWWDNGPQTVFESLGCGVPVLGAAVGGIPDFVKHGVNGLLFRGNDREDLKARFREIVAQPWIIDDLRKNVRPPKGIEEHAAELELMYAASVAGAVHEATAPSHGQSNGGGAALPGTRVVDAARPAAQEAGA